MSIESITTGWSILSYRHCYWAFEIQTLVSLTKLQAQIPKTVLSQSWTFSHFILQLQTVSTSLEGDTESAYHRVFPCQLFMEVSLHTNPAFEIKFSVGIFQLEVSFSQMRNEELNDSLWIHLGKKFKARCSFSVIKLACEHHLYHFNLMILQV